MTSIVRYGRKPTSEAAQRLSWRVAPEHRLVADAGWCLAAMIWGAVLVRLVLS